MRLVRHLALLVAVAVVAGAHRVPQQPSLLKVKGPQELRVVIASAPTAASIRGPGSWRLADAWGRVHVEGGRGAYRIERKQLRLRGASDNGRATAWSDEPFALLPARDGELVSWDGRRYRGELRFVATDTAILVINVVSLDDYLRGVVPVEIGRRQPNEASAVEAQAIAARSYTIVRALEGVTRSYDLTARTTDQVYGGADVEHSVADAAIRATSGLVLTYGGRVVRAPYHSTCGGATAAPLEVWSGRAEPYLQSVVDRDPDTDRAWCAQSPRFTWERVFDQRGLSEALARSGRSTEVGSVRMVRAESMTSSGRIAVLAIDTDRGTIRLRGNEIRFALRGVGGEILNSTYFSLEPIVGRDWRLTSVTMRGRGNGHGVGMCQWGALGRAHAGRDARSILAAYYPGTALARLE